MKRVCICGGGSLGHVIAGYLSAKKDVEVNILTQRPQLWKHELHVSTPEGDTLHGTLNSISDNPEDVLRGADIVLLCLPGYAIKSELIKIKLYVNSQSFVGSVFSSTGFFFEALELLSEDVPLWGFQRVPFIARTDVYGESAHLLGYKSSHNIAIERSSDKEEFRKAIEELFDAPDYLVPILPYYESHDAESLTRKTRSIGGFKGIKTPMILTERGWQPDLNSRYFQEDFMHGLRYIYQEAHRQGVAVPMIDMVYNWGIMSVKYSTNDDSKRFV